MVADERKGGSSFLNCVVKSRLGMTLYLVLLSFFAVACNQPTTPNPPPEDNTTSFSLNVYSRVVNPDDPDFPAELYTGDSIRARIVDSANRTHEAALENGVLTFTGVEKGIAKLLIYDADNSVSDKIFDYKRRVVVSDGKLVVADSERSPDVLPKVVNIDVGADKKAVDAYVELVTILGKSVKWSDESGALGLPNVFYHDQTLYRWNNGSYEVAGTISPDARFGTDLDYLVQNAASKASRNKLSFSSLPTESNHGASAVPDVNGKASPYIHFVWETDMPAGAAILVIDDYNGDGQKIRDILAFNANDDKYDGWGNFKTTAGNDCMEAWLNTALDLMHYVRAEDATSLPNDLVKALLSGIHWQGAGSTFVDYGSEKWDVDRYNTSLGAQQTLSDDLAQLYGSSNGVNVDEHAHQMNGQFVDNYVSKYCPAGSSIVELNGKAVSDVNSVENILMVHKDKVDSMVVKLKNGNGEDMYRRVSFTYESDVLKKAQPLPAELMGDVMPAPLN